MSHQKFTFSKNNKPKEFEYNPPQNELKYYQLSIFPNNNKYHIRRFTINELDDIVDIKEQLISKKQYDNFISTHKTHEYKLYSTYDLTSIQGPSLGDIHTAKSPLFR